MISYQKLTIWNFITPITEGALSSFEASVLGWNRFKRVHFLDTYYKPSQL